MAVKDAEHQLNLEISENEARKDFSKAERIDYARRLERIESLKARERMSDGGKGCQNSDNLRTDDAVAKKLRIGSRDTYRKEKYITENQNSLTPEDFAHSRGTHYLPITISIYKWRVADIFSKSEKRFIQ